MKAKDVIDRARILLQDAGADYWEQSELPKWLTDGRLEAYTLRPDLYQTFHEMLLAEGARQTLPGGSRRLFAVLRNVSHARQREITIADELALARHRPYWRSGPKAAEIVHFMYDELRPTVFSVYPPARDDVTVEISYAALPAAITAHESTAELTQEGEHAPALIDYVLYRAFQKEADTVPAFHDRALMHHKAFQAGMVGSVTAQAATSPNQGS